MNIRRIGVLLKKELKYSSKTYFFVYAVVAPVAGTLLVNLIFGSLFSGKPKLGVFDEGHSQIVESLKNFASINLKAYSSEIELKNAVKTGGRDVGIVLQENFDSLIKNGEVAKLKVYVWGESLLKNRAVAGSALLYQISDISGKKVPVDITPVPLGDKNNIPWKDRILPSIVLMAIFISGFAIPSTSLVEEKQKRTIVAVMTTPATQIDIFMSKGLMGVIISIAMGTLILIMNHIYYAQLGLITLLLFLGAIMASCFGLILGAFMKDVSSVYSAIQGLNIFIYMPAIVYLFPQMPKWIGKIFPAYYVINPIMEITQNEGSWATIFLDVLILIGILALLFGILGAIATKTRQQDA